MQTSYDIGMAAKKSAKKKSVAKKSTAKKKAVKKTATKKAVAKKAATKKAATKKTAVKKVAAKKVAAPAAPAVETAQPAKKKAAPPKGAVSALSVNLGHVFSLTPRVETSFQPVDLLTAKHQLQEEGFATIQDAARAVAEKALELAHGGSAKLNRRKGR